MAFNPYREWLGVDVSGGPITYYQLLGVAHGESDSEVIHAAVRNRGAQLRPHTDGEQQVAARRIIQEVNAAARCLSDPKLHADYDAKIGGIRSEVASAAPLRVATPLSGAGASHDAVAAPAVENPVGIQPVRTNVAAGSRSKLRRRSNSPAMAIGMLTAAALLIVVFVLVMQQLQSGGTAQLSPDVGSDEIGDWDSDEVVGISDDDSTVGEGEDGESDGGERSGASSPDAVPDGEFPGGAAGPDGNATPETVSPSQGGGISTRSPKPSPGGSAGGPGGRFNKAGGRFIGTGGTWSDDYDPIAFLPESERRGTSSTRATTPSDSGDAATTNGSGTPDNGPHGAAPVPVKKLGIPSEAKLAAATESIREVFDLDMSRTAEETVALLEELYETAHSTTDDPAAKFALFEMTRDIAAEHGYLGPALTVVDDIYRRFEVDTVKMATHVVLDTKVPTDDRVANGQCADVAVRLAELTRRQDKFELARELAMASVEAARCSGSKSLRERAKKSLRAVRESERAYETVRPALSTLATQPDDPQANALSGRYHCFVKEDWETGLAQLAIGDQEALASLARAEKDSPDDVEAKLALADGWYKQANDPGVYAEFDEESARLAILVHAAGWYESVLSFTSGLKKIRVERRLEEIATLTNSDEEADASSADGNPKRNIWFMQDASARVASVGTRMNRLPPAVTTDPRGPFRGHAAIFVAPADECTVIYEIEWVPHARSITLQSGEYHNFRMEILDKKTKAVLAHTTNPSHIGRSGLRPVTISVPRAAGPRFYLRLRNHRVLYLGALKITE